MINNLNSKEINFSMVNHRDFSYEMRHNQAL